MNALSPSQPDRLFHGLWSLWKMLETYFPIYQLGQKLHGLRRDAQVRKDFPAYSTDVQKYDSDAFRVILERITQICPDYGFAHTAELAKRSLDRPLPETYAEIFSALTYLDDSLSSKLEKESVLRIPPERKSYFEQDELFGPKVVTAFPSCERDIRKAGSCYALGQEDACVHHLMLVVERGLTALAARVNVTYHYADWQKILDGVETKLQKGQLPRGIELDFYRQAKAEFGFLKEAYRKHSAHARDDPYDLEKALSILNHVRDFMQGLEKGGLSE
jgi:hypothetical protein